MRWLALIGSIVSGCASDEEVVPVTSFRELYVHSTASSIVITFGEQSSGAHSEPCKLARPDLIARFNGTEIPVSERGGKVGEVDGANECADPEITIVTAPFEGASILELVDGEAEVTCAIPDMWAQRRATPVPPLPPGPWELSSGQQLAVQWFPGSDLQIRNMVVKLASRNASGAFDNSIGVLDQSVDGDLLSFTVPPLTVPSYRMEFLPSGNHRCDLSTMVVKLASISTRFSFYEEVTAR